MLRRLIDLLLFRSPPPVVDDQDKAPLPVQAPSPPPVQTRAPPSDHAPPPPAAPPAPAAHPGKKTISAAAIAMIAGVIAVEGGYINHKADPGGETNMGITKKVAVQNGYRGPMRKLPREVAESIYYERYLVGPGYEPLIALDAAVTEELFDTTVNMGAKWPPRWFQQSINALCGTSIAVDGRIGPGTIAAFASCQEKVGASKLCVELLNSLDAKQKARYHAIVRARPQSKVFLKGWLAHRIDNVDRRKCRWPER